MNRTKASFVALHAAVLTFAATLSAALACACAANDATAPRIDTPRAESATVSAAPTPTPSASVVAAKGGPCAPSDCTPCDESKQKCMGPMVCDNHPERASRQCKRDTDGQCRDMIVCAP